MYQVLSFITDIYQPSNTIQNCFLCAFAFIQHGKLVFKYLLAI